MKKVVVVGIGIGDNTLTLEALEAINNAEVLIGASRMLEIASGVHKQATKRQFPCYLAKETAAVIDSEEAEYFVVLVSGDVGFYSAATGLTDVLTPYEVRFIPGISSVNSFFAKLKLPWQDAAFISTHGRKADIVGVVRRNHFTFCLTGNNVNEIGSDLSRAGYVYVKTVVGENLGTESERIYDTTVGGLVHAEFPSLTVLLFQNDEFDGSVPSGLPDSRFSRLESIPMTKSETRAIVMSKLNLKPTSVCYDIGAGTGSVTVEMALAAYNGHVYAIERRGEAIPLINQNCTLFHLGNVTAVCGAAPDVFLSLPAPDAVFIGGSGGEIVNIISDVLDKNSNVRIVITAITLETVSLALTAFKNLAIEPEITQISIARTRTVGGLHMMEGQNPVTILSTGGISSAGGKT